MDPPNRGQRRRLSPTSTSNLEALSLGNLGSLVEGSMSTSLTIGTVACLGAKAHLVVGILVGLEGH